MSPIFAAALFYIFCNLFTIISVIKSKEYPTFLWYLLAPTLFFVLWLIISMVSSSIMGNAYA